MSVKIQSLSLKQTIKHEHKRVRTVEPAKINICQSSTHSSLQRRNRNKQIAYLSRPRLLFISKNRVLKEYRNFFHHEKIIQWWRESSASLRKYSFMPSQSHGIRLQITNRQAEVYMLESSIHEFCSTLATTAVHIFRQWNVNVIIGVFPSEWNRKFICN